MIVMEKEKKCPECGCREIVQSSFGADSKIYPINIIFKPGKGSEVIAEVCAKCGHILNMKVLNPEKLRWSFITLLFNT